jgi:hypothetical protein
VLHRSGNVHDSHGAKDLGVDPPLRLESMG